MFTRTSGVLLHVTSLPSRYGVGDLGPEAHSFVDLLARSGQRHWQILPISPTAPGLGNSPYSSYSAFAGNALWISPDLLLESGLARQGEVEDAMLPVSAHCDYATAGKAKESLLWRIFERVEGGLLDDQGFCGFLDSNAIWLNDYALFAAAKERFGGLPWYRWPGDLRDRREEALRRFGLELARPILFEKFRQHLFFSQWGRLREHMQSKGVGLMGDVPIYVTHDSADVWANRGLFKLDGLGMPIKVAGVPPDYFSATGQRWGNPVFDWPANEAEGFAWWLSRLRHAFGLFDQARLDHFRGFAAYVQAPGKELLSRLEQDMGSIPLIAEDLGVITPDVVALKERFGLPGMFVLQFSFGEDMPHIPDALHNHEPNAVAYVGTHDNNTARGWHRQDCGPEDRKRLELYAGRKVREADAAPTLIRLLLSSAARTAVVTAQDVLNLDGSCRMNTPGKAEGNWTWRLLPGQLGDAALAGLAELTALYGRDNVPIGKNDSYEKCVRPTCSAYS